MDPGLELSETSFRYQRVSCIHDILTDSSILVRLIDLFLRRSPAAVIYLFEDALLLFNDRSSLLLMLVCFSELSDFPSDLMRPFLLLESLVLKEVPDRSLRERPRLILIDSVGGLKFSSSERHSPSSMNIRDDYGACFFLMLLLVDRVRRRYFRLDADLDFDAISRAWSSWAMLR